MPKKGYKQSIEHKDTLSKVRKGRIPWNENMYPLLRNESFLFQRYIIEKQSMGDIALNIGCCLQAVQKALIRFNIPRRNLSEAHKGQHSSPNTEFKKGQKPLNKGILQSAKQREKHSKVMQKKWKDLDYIRKQMKGRKASPNKLELLVNKILETNYPNQWRFNGNLECGIVIGGMIPDFVNINGKKEVIEVFGDYWHKRIKRWNYSEFGRIATYSQLGYKCYVFWGSELEQKPEEFIKKSLEG